MLIPTHRVISQILLTEIKRYSGVELEEKYFIYGNVLPDIAPKYIITKHFINESIDFLIYRIDSLLNNNNITPRKFAVELGIITHYLCDYYCVPHNDRAYFKGKVNEHMLYEKKLHTKFKQGYDLSGFKQNINPYSKEPVREFIYFMLDKYILDEKSFEKDIMYSLYVASKVSLYIIENSKFYLKYIELEKLQM